MESLNNNFHYSQQPEEKDEDLDLAIQLSLEPQLQEKDEELERAITLSLELLHKEKNFSESRQDALKIKTLRKLNSENAKNDFSTVPEGEDLLVDFALERIEECKIFSSYPKHNQKIVKNIALQSLEIKNLYKKTHYILTHGQSTEWLATSFLIKALVKTFYPEKDTHGFKFLRIPPYVDSTATREIPITDDLWDHDSKTREHLLSVTPYIFDDTAGESALEYVSRNHSILQNSESVKQVYTDIFKKFAGSKCSLDLLEKCVTTILEEQQKLTKDATCGVLYTLCIPKSTADETKEKMLYRSHAFGRKCACHPSSEDPEILNKLQNNILDKSTQCDPEKLNYKGTDVCTMPQYRVQIKNVTPEQGSIIFRHTPFNKKELRNFKKKINEVVEILKA